MSWHQDFERHYRVQLFILWLLLGSFYPKETNVKSWQSLWMFDSKGNVILETIHIKKLRNQLELIINKSNFNGKYIFLFLFHLVLNRNRFGLNMKFYLNLQIPSALSGTWFWKKEVGILAKKAKKNRQSWLLIATNKTKQQKQGKAGFGLRQIFGINEM